VYAASGIRLFDYPPEADERSSFYYLTISAKRKIYMKMKVFDIYKLENSNANKCYLIKDGIFWRAWEKSAMLFSSSAHKIL
jgi:hypothetical protein